MEIPARDACRKCREELCAILDKAEEQGWSVVELIDAMRDEIAR